MCPKCGFAHYGAHYVYGSKCYSYAKTQKPWIDKKMTAYLIELEKDVRRSCQGESLSYLEIRGVLKRAKKKHS